MEEPALEVPTDFPSFPFQPYSIQTEFMKELFHALDSRKLGIFESPTGTGKSLSLLCGSLTWFLKKEEQRLSDLRSLISGFNQEAEEKRARGQPDWVKAQSELIKRKDMVFKARRELEFLEKLIQERDKNLKSRKSKKNLMMMEVHMRNSSRMSKVLQKSGSQNKTEKHDPDLDPVDLLLNDEFAPDLLSDSDCSDNEEDELEEPEFYPLRVIFASRTHSQLSQFVNEMKRTQFVNLISTATLGSRQNLCINSDVNKLKSLSLINERCLDLQKNSKGKKPSETKKIKGCGGCPYFNHSGIEALKTHILSEPLDLEELVSISKTEEFSACPYYASRKASKKADLLLVPYNSILHSGTREGIGLHIKNSVLILDEAHNIVESISNMYSTHLTFIQVKESLMGLQTYMTRYKSRFGATNLLLLKQVLFIAKLLKKYLEKSPKDFQKVFSLREFKTEVGIEEINIYDLNKFIKKAKLVFKLKGYLLIQAKLNTPQDDEQRSSAGGAILNFSEFLKSLTCSDADARIIQDGTNLKFLLLNTARIFSYIVDSTRSIILAGGTMKPYDDIETQLFASSKDRIQKFSCSHVIPDENLLCIALSQGPSSVLFDFTFKNRNSKALMDELSRTVLNISNIVPAGLVIFLPSYEFEAGFYSRLKEDGILGKIESRKKVFREPKETSCDRILADYSRQVRNSSGGAILLAVVGGKLSEGINFSDDLGRCVIIVGLPYPNITSAEVKEKVNFVSERLGPERAKEVLPNACFKAVNQSIGRSIRHAKDYASIILLDHRYTFESSRVQLPSWILKKYLACNSFGQCATNLEKFFQTKQIKS